MLIEEPCWEREWTEVVKRARVIDQLYQWRCVNCGYRIDASMDMNQLEPPIMKPPRRRRAVPVMVCEPVQTRRSWREMRRVLRGLRAPWRARTMAVDRQALWRVVQDAVAATRVA